MNHPPIPISELAEHTELLKANDNLKLSQEYEVSGPKVRVSSYYWFLSDCVFIGKAHESLCYPREVVLSLRLSLVFQLVDSAVSGGAWAMVKYRLLTATSSHVLWASTKARQLSII